MKLIRIYFLIYIFWRVGSSKVNYFEGLIKYLNEKSKLHQVVFIVDDLADNVDPIMNSIMAVVNSHFPSFSLSYSEISSNLTKLHFQRLYRPRSTTLFVLQWIDDSTMDIFNDFLVRDEKLLLWSSLPRCLVVNLFNSTHEYINRTLHSFWEKDYLDVTFLTYNDDSKVTIEPSANGFPLLSQLNPFFNKYSSSVVSYETPWFPNKLVDLNGYKLNFTVQPLNYSSNDVEIQGKRFLEILQKLMNFCPNVIPFTLDTEHLMMGRNDSEYMQVFNKWTTDLVEIKSEISLTYAIQNSDYTDIQNLRIMGFFSADIVVPKKVKPTGAIRVSPEFWYMVSASVCIIAIIKFIAFLLKFRRRTWQTLHISQFIIGMALPEEPEHWSERIVFGSLLIACIVYTSYFYSIILDVSFRPAPEISSVAELIKSNLSSNIDFWFTYMFENHSNPDIQQLIDKSTVTEYVMDCLYTLADYQNVSCIFSNAVESIKEYESEFGDLNVKILPEKIVHGFESFMGRKYSPYNDRYNEIIQKASEAGLIKSYSSSEKLLTHSVKPELIMKNKLLPILLSVLAIGYSLSIIVFLLEVIKAKFGNRILHKAKIQFGRRD